MVTALHGHDESTPWATEEIAARKKTIEEAGLAWSVVESIPVHPSVKLGDKNAKRHVSNYIHSIRNLASVGIHTICYNFMPVLDWTRTDLNYKLPSGAIALRFDLVDLAAYDLFTLRRKDADGDYCDAVKIRAEHRFSNMSREAQLTLENTLIAGLPGSEHSHGRREFEVQIARFSELSASDLRVNLLAFLHQVVPAAEEVGSRLCIHPDDPPFSLFGLPRIVGNREDLAKIFGAIPSIANGLTLCTGSLGVSQENDLTSIAHKFGTRIHFAHLRNITRQQDAFYESGHLEGNVDMAAIIAALLSEERNRCSSGRSDWQIPMRPDHGHILLDDFGKQTNPGYSAIGRLKGLAELRGVVHAMQLPGTRP